jgi:hypothetical protein
MVFIGLILIIGMDFEGGASKNGAESLLLIAWRRNFV